MNGEMQNNQGMSAAQYLSQISAGVPNPNIPINQPQVPKQSGNWKWVWVLAGILLILVVVLVIMLIPFGGESAVDKMVQNVVSEEEDTKDETANDSDGEKNYYDIYETDPEKLVNDGWIMF